MKLTIQLLYIHIWGVALKCSGLVLLVSMVFLAHTAHAACPDPTSRVSASSMRVSFQTIDTVNAGFAVVDSTATTEGTMIYDPSDKKLLLCNGTEWNAFSMSVEGMVANVTTIGLSCKDILDNGHSKGDGAYWIKPSASSAIYKLYCDMTNGGWTMIQGGGLACGTSMPAVGALISPTSCGYLAQSAVALLANNSTQVQLRAGASGTGYASATSTNALAIDALKSPTATWHNGATFSAWDWRISCATGASGWPFMFQACGHPEAVHWGPPDETGGYPIFDKDWYRTSQRTSTWLR